MCFDPQTHFSDVVRQRIFYKTRAGPKVVCSHQIMNGFLKWSGLMFWQPDPENQRLATKQCGGEEEGGLCYKRPRSFSVEITSDL
jgi:hypothetical protein